MKQTITRTITSTEITYAIIEVVDGEPTVTKADPIKANGNLNMKQALKVLENELDLDENVTYKITNLKYNTNAYEMSVNDFIENSKIVTKGVN